MEKEKLIPIYSNRGDIQSCANQHVMELMSSYSETLRKSDRVQLYEYNKSDRELIWIYVRQIYKVRDILTKKIDGNLSHKEEKSIYGK